MKTQVGKVGPLAYQISNKGSKLSIKFSLGKFTGAIDGDLFEQAEDIADVGSASTFGRIVKFLTEKDEEVVDPTKSGETVDTGVGGSQELNQIEKPKAVNDAEQVTQAVIDSQLQP